MIKRLKSLFTKEKNEEEEIKSLPLIQNSKKQTNKKRKKTMAEKRQKNLLGNVQLKETRPSESKIILNSIKEEIDTQSKFMQDLTYDISDIKETVNNMVKHQTHKHSGIIERVDSSKNYLTTNIRESKESILQSIKNIKTPVIPKIPQDYLKKDDFDFSLTQKFYELQESMDSMDALEVLPKKIADIDIKLNDLSQKIENISVNPESSTQGIVPKEEKSISDLAGFMRDGITQFEHISKEYISKVSELENLENLKLSHQKSLQEMEVKSFDAGKKAGEIAFIKNFLEQTPSLVQEIQSKFLVQKYLVDEIITIDNKNKNELSVYFNGTIEIGEYRVISCATLLDGMVVIKAELEKVEMIEVKTIEKIEKVEKDG